MTAKQPPRENQDSDNDSRDADLLDKNAAKAYQPGETNVRDKIYRLLEEKMISYAELIDVPVDDNGETLVPIPTSDTLVTRQIDPNMLAITGEEIYVRESVARMLDVASQLLVASQPDVRLEVVYGYRSADIQRSLYQQFKQQFAQQYSGIELEEAVHRLVAVPDVAGHPTGGAVDIRLVTARQPLETGTQIWQFEPDSYTFSPFISRGAWRNRQQLRQLMMQVGFAPFDGEWWHFSFGDREWAKFYAARCARYAPVDFAATD